MTGRCQPKADPNKCDVLQEPPLTASAQLGLSLEDVRVPAPAYVGAKRALRPRQSWNRTFMA